MMIGVTMMVLECPASVGQAIAAVLKLIDQTLNPINLQILQGSSKIQNYGLSKKETYLWIIHLT